MTTLSRKLPRPGGVLLGRYEVERYLSSGGEGAVFHGVDQDTGNAVALKVWTVADAPGEELPDEARALLELSHPGVVRALDAGFDADLGSAVLVLEHLEGQELVSAWQTSDAAGQRLLAQRLIEAVAYLQRQGVIHADLKPDNILVVDDEGPRPVIIDFGMAGQLATSTFRGGTPAYMAPELAAGGCPDFRTDLFALGLVLLQAARGAPRPRRTIPADLELDPVLGAILPRLLNQRATNRFRDGDAALTAWRVALGEGFRARLPERLPLVGRADVLDAALEVLDAFVEPRPVPTVLSFSGESGSGRRRLLDELRLRCRAHGVRSVWHEPGTPVRRFLEQILRTLGRDPAQRRTDAARIFAPHEALMGRTAPPEERAAAFVSELPGAHRLVIGGFLGGAGDEQFRAFMTTLARLEQVRRDAGEGARLLLAVSGEPAEVELMVERQDHSLHPLSEPDLVGLLQEVCGARRRTEALAEVASRIHSATGGRPRLVEEALRSTARSGALQFVLGDVTCDRQAFGRDLSGGLAGLARLRWDGLDPAERRLITLLAVAREPTVGTVLQGAGASGDSDQVQALASLKDSGLIARVGSGAAAAWRLSWPELGRQALEASTQDERRALHARLAALLSGSRGLRHRLGAGDAAVLPEVITAIDTSWESGDHRTVLDLAGVAATSGLAAGRTQELLLLNLARAELAAGRLSDAEERLRGLQDSSEVDVAWQTASCLCQVALSRGDAVAAAEEARRFLDLAPDPGVGVRALCALGYACLNRGDSDGARDAAERALERTSKAGGLESLAHNLLGLVASRGADLEDARQHFNLAIDAFRAQGDELGAAVAAINLGAVQVRAGELEQATRLLQDARRTFSAGGHFRYLAITLTNLALAHDQNGRPLSAAGRHAEAARLFQGLAESDRAAMTRASEGISLLHAGRPRQARSQLLHALGHWNPRLNPRGRILATAACARAEARLGRTGRGLRRALSAVRKARRKAGIRRELGMAALAVAENCTELPRRRRWATRARRALEESGERAAYEARLLEAATLQALGQGGEARLLLDEMGTLPPAADGQRALLLATGANTEEAFRLLAAALRHALRAGDLLLQVRCWMAVAVRAVEISSYRRARLAFRRSFQRLEEMEQGMDRKRSAFLRAALLGDQLRDLAEAAERRLGALDRSGSGSAALELTEVLRLLNALNAEGRMKGLLEQIIDSALQLTGADSGFVVLLEADDLKPAASRSRDGRRVPAPLGRISTSITHEVVATGRTLLVNDALEDDRFQGLMSVARNRIRSLACVPLKTDMERIGALYLDAGERQGAFDDEQIPLIEAYADLAALAIRNLRRSTDLERDRKRLESDLRTQRSVALAFRRAAEQQRRDAGLVEILGESASIQDVRDLARRAAESDTTVLVTGESGVGKELVANEICRNSPRRDRPFVSLNCANLPENLFESELFGHKKGAFTGAEADHPGLFVLANRGTLFLDEIGEMPSGVQAKLLRVLQEGRVRPLGGRTEKEVDVRIVAATNRDLREMVADGTFREDLFYRVRVVEIAVPPLRERTADIPCLAEHFLRLAHREKRFTQRALKALERYPWPGNVRQLKNEVDRAALLSDGDRIDVGDLSRDLVAPSAAAPSLLDGEGQVLPLKEVERRMIGLALTQTGDDRQAAAKLLGISRSTLYEKLKRLPVT